MDIARFLCDHERLNKYKYYINVLILTLDETGFNLRGLQN